MRMKEVKRTWMRKKGKEQKAGVNRYSPRRQKLMSMSSPTSRSAYGASTARGAGDAINHIGERDMQEMEAADGMKRP